MKKAAPIAFVLALAAQPLAAGAQSTDAPPPYGPKLYDTPEQEAAAMRAFAARQKEAASRQDPARRKLAPRRPTRQQPITMPPSAYSTSGYQPMAVPVPGPGVTPVVPSAPMPVQCIGGSCVRADGVAMPPAVGSTTIDAQGRQCVQNGNFVQCF